MKNSITTKTLEEFKAIEGWDKMFSFEIYNHYTEKTLDRISFPSKRVANKWLKNNLKNNIEKRGYCFFSKTDRSIEFCQLF